MSGPRTLALVGAAALLLASAAPILAQDDTGADSPMDTEGLTLDVGGVEYAFTDLPTSVPVGTSLSFTNNGAEVHEIVLVRIADGVTESLEELLAMDAEGRDPMEEGLVEMVGDMPLFAAPGTTAEGTLTLESEGRHVVLCFIPQGLTDMSVLEQLGPEANPEDMSPEVQAIMANPPHFALGMIQEFTVTPAGTEVGPLPEAASDEMAPDEESAPEDEDAASE
jgi:plastocyanin